MTVIRSVKGLGDITDRCVLLGGGRVAAAGLAELGARFAILDRDTAACARVAGPVGEAAVARSGERSPRPGGSRCWSSRSRRRTRPYART